MSKRYEVVCQSEEQRSLIMKRLQEIKKYDDKPNGYLILNALKLYLACEDLEVVLVKDAKELKGVMFNDRKDLH